eukprot:s1738_g1.t1
MMLHTSSSRASRSSMRSPLPPSASESLQRLRTEVITAHKCPLYSTCKGRSLSEPETHSLLSWPCWAAMDLRGLRWVLCLWQAAASIPGAAVPTQAPRAMISVKDGVSDPGRWVASQVHSAGGRAPQSASSDGCDGEPGS